MINLKNRPMHPLDAAKLRDYGKVSPIASTYVEFLIEWHPLIVQLSPEDRERFMNDLCDAFRNVVSTMSITFRNDVYEIITKLGGRNGS